MRLTLTALLLLTGCADEPAELVVPTFDAQTRYVPAESTCAEVMPATAVSNLLGAQVRLVPDTATDTDLRCMYKGTEMLGMSSATVRIDCDDPDLLVPRGTGRVIQKLADIGDEAYLSLDRDGGKRFAAHVGAARTESTNCSVRVETMGLPAQTTERLTAYAAAVAELAEVEEAALEES